MNVMMKKKKRKFHAVVEKIKVEEFQEFILMICLYLKLFSYYVAEYQKHFVLLTLAEKNYNKQVQDIFLVLVATIKRQIKF